MSHETEQKIRAMAEAGDPVAIAYLIKWKMA